MCTTGRCGGGLEERRGRERNRWWLADFDAAGDSPRKKNTFHTNKRVTQYSNDDGRARSNYMRIVIAFVNGLIK